MWKIIIPLLFLLIEFRSIFAQPMDFHRIGASIYPLFWHTVEDSSEISHRRGGLRLENSFWPISGIRQYQHLLAYKQDKKQVFTMGYVASEIGEQEAEGHYLRRLHPALIAGVSFSYGHIQYAEGFRFSSLTSGLTLALRVWKGSYFLGRYLREPYGPFIRTRQQIFWAMHNKINDWFFLDFSYVFSTEHARGLRVNVRTNLKPFSLRIGWEPLPYAFQGGISYHLLRYCTFGIDFRHHQWLGLLTQIHFQFEKRPTSR